MRVTVNGQPYETGVATLAELLSELDYDGAVVATAPERRVRPKGQAPADGDCGKRRDRSHRADEGRLSA